MGTVYEMEKQSSKKKAEKSQKGIQNMARHSQHFVFKTSENMEEQIPTNLSKKLPESRTHQSYTQPLVITLPQNRLIGSVRSCTAILSETSASDLRLHLIKA